MSKSNRCPRCFAPKNSPEEVCEFCGYDIVKEKNLSISAAKYFEYVSNKDPLPDGIPLEDRIQIIQARNL